MIIRQAVHDLFAVAAEAHEARLLEDAQLVRHRTLRGSHFVGDGAHRLSLLHEGIENLDTRGVGKDLEQVGQVVEQFLVGHLRTVEVGDVACAMVLAAAAAFLFAVKLVNQHVVINHMRHRAFHVCLNEAKYILQRPARLGTAQEKPFSPAVDIAITSCDSNLYVYEHFIIC